MTRVTTVAVMYSTDRSRSSGEVGRSQSSWSRISQRIIATIDRTVAALIRHGPIVSANNQIVLVASAIAPVAKAPTSTFDSPVTSRHGRLARTIPDSSRSLRSPDGAKYRIPPLICADGNRRAAPEGMSSGSPRTRAIASSVTVRTRRSMWTPPTPATEMSANLWSALPSPTTGKVSSRRGRSVRYDDVFLFGGRIDRVDDIGEISLLVGEVGFAAHARRPPTLEPARAAQAFRQGLRNAFRKSRRFARIRDEQHRDLLTPGTGLSSLQVLVHLHRIRVPARTAPRLQEVGTSRSAAADLRCPCPYPVDPPTRRQRA